MPTIWPNLTKLRLKRRHIPGPSRTTQAIHRETRSRATAARLHHPGVKRKPGHKPLSRTVPAQLHQPGARRGPAHKSHPNPRRTNPTRSVNPHPKPNAPPHQPDPARPSLTEPRVQRTQPDRHRSAPVLVRQLPFDVTHVRLGAHVTQPPDRPTGPLRRPGQELQVGNGGTQPTTSVARRHRRRPTWTVSVSSRNTSSLAPTYSESEGFSSRRSASRSAGCR